MIALCNLDLSVHFWEYYEQIISVVYILLYMYIQFIKTFFITILLVCIYSSLSALRMFLETPCYVFILLYLHWGCFWRHHVMLKKVSDLLKQVLLFFYVGLFAHKSDTFFHYMTVRVTDLIWENVRKSFTGTKMTLEQFKIFRIICIFKF